MSLREYAPAWRRRGPAGQRLNVKQPRVIAHGRLGSGRRFRDLVRLKGSMNHAFHVISPNGSLSEENGDRESKYVVPHN
jgi:hypothetical protein